MCITTVQTTCTCILHHLLMHECKSIPKGTVFLKDIMAKVANNSNNHQPPTTNNQLQMIYNSNESEDDFHLGC